MIVHFLIEQTPQLWPAARLLGTGAGYSLFTPQPVCSCDWVMFDVACLQLFTPVSSVHFCFSHGRLELGQRKKFTAKYYLYSYFLYDFFFFLSLMQGTFALCGLSYWRWYHVILVVQTLNIDFFLSPSQIHVMEGEDPTSSTNMAKW